METFRFIKFQVYQDGKSFYSKIINLTGSFPRPYWELGEQLRRASLSVCLNIAEGSAKYSDKEFYRFLEIAQGSIHECLAGLDIARDQKLIHETVFQRCLNETTQIAKQIGGLSKKIRK